MKQYTPNSVQLQEELARRATRPLKIKEISVRLSTIGYVLDRSMDCQHTARYMTGPHAGATYPCTSTGITHVASGLPFSHINAPRDENFRTLQNWRLSGEFFAVCRGTILEI